MKNNTKKCCSCKQELSIDNFDKNRSRTDGLHNACKVCKRAHNKKYRSTHGGGSHQTSDQKKIQYIKRQEHVLSYLMKHSCVDCGERDVVVLDFDHVRGTKSNSVSRMVSSLNSLETIDLEIEKCEVRCANCHRRKTAIERGWYKDIDFTSL